MKFLIISFFLKSIIARRLDSYCTDPNCDDCFPQTPHICYDCEDFYHADPDGKCVLCSTDMKCKECKDSGYCTDCVANLVPVGGVCVSKKTIPNYDKNCEEYDTNYQCLFCDDDCYIEEGKCSCPDEKNNKTVIIVVVVVIVVLLIVAGVLLFFFWWRKKKQQQQQPIEQKVATVEIGDVYEKPYDRRTKLGSELYEKPKEDQKFFEKPDAIEESPSRFNKDNEDEETPKTEKLKYEKCSLCKKNPGIYKLSCGCYLCYTHIGTLEEYAKDANRTVQENCPACGKEVTKVRQVHRECGVCFEIKDSIFSLSCGCNFEICEKCFETVLEKGRCPGCRKNIDGNLFPLPPLDQSAV